VWPHCRHGHHNRVGCRLGVLVGRWERWAWQSENKLLYWLVGDAEAESFCVWWVWQWAQHVQLVSGTKIESLILVEVGRDSQLVEGRER
jgi:hypothetical protein